MRIYLSLFFCLSIICAFHSVFAEESMSPSFDCKKAVTSVELDICSHPDTAALDKKVAAAYFDLKDHPGDRLKVSVHELVKDQQDWLANRGKDNCSGDCLRDKYSKRLEVLTFPGAPEKLSDEKLKELISYFSDKSCESVSPLSDSKIMQSEGFNTFACKVYEVNPGLGDKLFSSCYGSNMDNFTPSCDFSETIKKVDGLKEYTEFLGALYGADKNGCGSMRYAAYREQNSAVLQALVNINPAGDVNDSPKLQHFALQGIWEKGEYASYLKLKQRAEKGLEKYYVAVKKASAAQAKKAALIHVSSLTKVYIDEHYSSYDDWGLSELNDFLKTGVVPNNKNFEYETVLNINDQKADVKPDVLAYFLKLAIVNNYSKSDIEKIIDAGANLNNPQLSDTALMNSVSHLDILKLLITKGANVNTQNSFGKTALMYAIQYGNLDAVKALVEAKADVNLATNKLDDWDCEHALSAGNRTPLMYAAWHANTDVLKYLLSKGAKADAKDSEGNDYTFYLKKNDYKK